MLRSLSGHPHIVEVHDFIENDDVFVMIMDLVRGGDLFDYIVKNKPIESSHAKFLFRQMAESVCFLHR